MTSQRGRGEGGRGCRWSGLEAFTSRFALLLARLHVLKICSTLIACKFKSFISQWWQGAYSSVAAHLLARLFAQRVLEHHPAGALDAPLQHQRLQRGLLRAEKRAEVAARQASGQRGLGGRVTYLRSTTGTVAVENS